jgi:hypothetical protein
MSKGSRPRPYSVPLNQFDNQWDTIFGKKDKDMQVKVNEEVGKCGCGRSPSGKCIGWHALSESDFQAKLATYVAEQDAKDES